MSLRSALGKIFVGRAGGGEVGAAQAQSLQRDGAVLLDVRSRQEFRAGHAPKAKNIPVDQLAGRL